MRTPLAPLLAPLLLLVLASPAPAGFVNPVGDLKQCITASKIRAYSAENEQSLLIHVGGSRAYRNHLPHGCDHLKRVNDLAKIKISHKEMLCKGDAIRVVGNDILDPLGDGQDQTRCTLGGFEPISEMSITEELRR